MEIRRKFALTRPQGSHWAIGKVDLRNLFLAHDGPIQFTVQCLLAVSFPLAKLVTGLSSGIIWYNYFTMQVP